MSTKQTHLISGIPAKKLNMAADNYAILMMFFDCTLQLGDYRFDTALNAPNEGELFLVFLTREKVSNKRARETVLVRKCHPTVQWSMTIRRGSWVVGVGKSRG